MADKAKEWTTFIHQCLLQRIPETEFYSLSKLLIARNSLPGSNVLQILLKSRGNSVVPYEPLVPKYTVKLLLLGRIVLPEVLTILLDQSLLSETKEGQSIKGIDLSPQIAKLKVDDSLASDFNVIQEVTAAFNNGATLQSASDISRTLSTISKWISAILSRTAKDQAEGIGHASLTASVFAVPLFEAIGILLVALLENERVMQFICSAHNRGECGAFQVVERDLPRAEIKSKLGRALTSYVPFINQISIALATKLDGFQKQYDLYDHRSSTDLGENLLQGVVSDGLHFEDSVLDSPIVNSRAGLYVYINAMVRRELIPGSHILKDDAARWATFD
jgi:mediator of RNA polymerase II transcription subunit 5